MALGVEHEDLVGPGEVALDLVDPVLVHLAGPVHPPQEDAAHRLVRAQFPERNAVDRATLDIPPYTYIGITGSSSSGRSTLLKLMNGLILPSEGSVRYDDVPVSLYLPRELRRQIAADVNYARRYFHLLSKYGLH